MGRGAQQATVYGVAEVPDMTVNSHTHTHTLIFWVTTIAFLTAVTLIYDIIQVLCIQHCFYFVVFLPT